MSIGRELTTDKIGYGSYHQPNTSEARRVECHKQTVLGMTVAILDVVEKTLD